MSSKQERFARVVGAVGVLSAMMFLYASESSAQNRRTITLDDVIEIDGVIQKPEAFFILPRTSLNFEDLERREDLKQRIIDAVEIKPF